MAELPEGFVDALVEAVGADRVVVGDAVSEDYGHDEALTVDWPTPDAVVLPGSTDDVAAMLRLAARAPGAGDARGSGTGLSGACVAVGGRGRGRPSSR